MTRVNSSRWFGKASAASYVVILLVVLVATLAMKVRLRGVFACPASYGSIAYLSDCNAPNYGDYDHGAFWFELEPEALHAASRAKVILLGNSRIQFASSSPATARWFGDRSIPFYSLGFSHYESITFLTPVLARVQPHASAYVINADHFFAEWLSPTSHRIFYERDVRARYDEKWFWQRLHKPICGALPFLCGKEFAVYRNVANGMWFTSGTPPKSPARVSDGAPGDMERWPHYIDLAKGFIDGLKVDRRCVVLTIVPTVGTKRAEAEAIAAALGLQFIAPRIDDLSTFDGSHLSAESAARWSAAFLEAAGPVLERCASGQGAHADAQGAPAHGS
ncbi:MAG: hypothetical protein ABI460_04490 [Caldimonas sp.]